jgi:hypothetical protein
MLRTAFITLAAFVPLATVQPLLFVAVYAPPNPVM